ncbi:unnamed protein product [Lactuca virosa]|uniref:RRM domain-containing protein n=1 Tax=Lactuca virosa TaxID=75947 RepID=A0AAU9NCB8_9ASTR|nr:unnamed protein product [Lactuca virosa]
MVGASEWTEVRRKKNTTSREIPKDETSFFVTNIPNGATKSEFRKLFSHVGRLTDIYFGDKRGYNGKNFGFIRYIGVDQPKEMEKRLQGVQCRGKILEINIAKHGRKPLNDNRVTTAKLQVPKSKNFDCGASGFVG